MKFWISGWDPKGAPLIDDTVMTVFISKDKPIHRPEAFEVQTIEIPQFGPDIEDDEWVAMEPTQISGNLAGQKK